MKKCILLIGVLAVFWGSNAWGGTGFTVRGGTLGIGLEVTQSIVPKVNARIGYNFFKYDYETTEDNIRYEFDLRLRSANFLADFHPLSGFMAGFRLSGGFLYSKNRVDMKALPSGTYEIGGQTFTAAEVGTLTGKVDLKDWPIYLGIGWGNASSGFLGLALDIGVAFSGSPAVDLATSGGDLSGDADFQRRLVQEEADLEDEIKAFNYYPNLSLGLSFHIPGL